ncbi:MAG TPA: GNAT family N-acetyltransferase [Miltoncostaea sp.]|nr:GNAT family N-acetyltransferase [Miltoncostaea sp.]
MSVLVQPADVRPVADAEVERLLVDAYVGGGFTSPERAARVFAADAVRARGDLLCAWLPGVDAPAGMVLVVAGGAPAARLTREGESEMHLLATSPDHRRAGVGRALVAAAMAHAREGGASRMMLWTQPAMHAAQSLYRAAGFVRVPERDFGEEGRTFLVFAAGL